MAKIKLGELIMDISGSIRNHVFSKWNGRHYIRTNASYIGNPKTDAQQTTIRKEMSELSKSWNHVLTDVQRAGWESFAKAYGSVRDGQSKKAEPCIIPQNSMLMSGYNAYIMNNMLLRSSGNPYALILDAPQGFAGPTMPEMVSVVHDPVAAKLTVTINQPTYFGAYRDTQPAQGFIRVWHKPAVNKHSRLAFTQAVGVDEEGLPLIMTIFNYSEYDTNQPLQPGHNIVQCDMVNLYGLRSGPTTKAHVILPQPVIVPGP